MLNLRNVWNMVAVELVMEAKTRYKYLASTLSDFVIFTLTYFAVLFFSDVSAIDSGYQTHDGILLVLIGYMFWTVGVVAMDTSTQTIESDSKAGILEMELQSKFPLWFLGLVRSLVANLITFAYLLIVGVITALVSAEPLVSIVEIIFWVMLISCISNLGMFGLGLIFGAGSLVFKSVGQWSTLLQGAILIVANVAVPYTSSIQSIIPFGSGIEIVRNLFLHQNVTLGAVLIYLVVNAVYFGVGLCIFKIALKHERKSGSFERF